MSFQAEGLVVQKYEWNVAVKWVRESLKIAHQHFFYIWGFMLVGFAIRFVVGLAPFIGSAISNLVEVIMLGSLNIIIAAWAVGEKPGFGRIFGLFDTFERLKPAFLNLGIMAFIQLSFSAIGFGLALVGIKAEEIKELSSRLAVLDQQTLILVCMGFLWFLIGGLISWWAMVAFLIQMKHGVSARAALELSVSNTTHNLIPYLVSLPVFVLVSVGTVITLFIGMLWVLPMTQFFTYMIIRDGFKKA